MKILGPQVPVAWSPVGEVNDLRLVEACEQCRGPNGFVIGMRRKNDNASATIAATLAQTAR
jgi:hypothetical protein